MEELASRNSEFGLLQVFQEKQGPRRWYLNDYLTQNSYDILEKKSTSMFTFMPSFPNVSVPLEERAMSERRRREDRTSMRFPSAFTDTASICRGLPGFQGSTIFGITPLAYVAVTIIIALLIDQVFDNLVAPRVMAQNLRVHPAFVLIAAIIAANLVGVLGVIIAAPLPATFQLGGRYTMR